MNTNPGTAHQKAFSFCEKKKMFVQPTGSGILIGKDSILEHFENFQIFISALNREEGVNFRLPRIDPDSPFLFLE